MSVVFSEDFHRATSTLFTPPVRKLNTAVSIFIIYFSVITHRKSACVTVSNILVCRIIWDAPKLINLVNSIWWMYSSPKICSTRNILISGISLYWYSIWIFFLIHPFFNGETNVEGIYMIISVYCSINGHRHGQVYSLWFWFPVTFRIYVGQRRAQILTTQVSHFPSWMNCKACAFFLHMPVIK